MTPPAPLPRRGTRGEVIRATSADTGTLSQVIADAFFGLPQSRWLIPGQAARRSILPGYFQLLLEHAIASGIVCTTAGRDAAAVWLPAGHPPGRPPGDYGTRLAAATGVWLDRFTAFDATLDRHHPAGVPHRHLAILAVRPDRQAQGTGSMLLRACHQLLDQRGIPAYLEAAELRTRRLYLRHGYVLRPDAPFFLPSGGPPMWPMWRDARRPQSRDDPTRPGSATPGQPGEGR